MQKSPLLFRERAFSLLIGFWLARPFLCFEEIVRDLLSFKSRLLVPHSSVSSFGEVFAKALCGSFSDFLNVVWSEDDLDVLFLFPHGDFGLFWEVARELTVFGAFEVCVAHVFSFGSRRQSGGVRVPAFCVCV
jgi:hypothetical protein